MHIFLSLPSCGIRVDAGRGGETILEMGWVPISVKWADFCLVKVICGFKGGLMTLVIHILRKIFGRSSKEISCMDSSPYKLTKVLPISAPLKFSVQSVQGLLKEHTYARIEEFSSSWFWILIKSWLKISFWQIGARLSRIGNFPDSFSAVCWMLLIYSLGK